MAEEGTGTGSQDWLADVRRYVADADEAVVKKIVNYCGIALRKRDSSLVSMSDPVETGRVRENYLKKKLGLTQDDATLDGAIQAVGERMKADNFKNRVTVYYLLAEHFDVLDIFGAAKRAASGAAVAAAPLGLAAMAVAANEPASAAPAAAAAPATPVAPVKLASSGGGSAKRYDESDGVIETGCIALIVMLGAIALAALLAWLATRDTAEETPAAAPVEAAAPAPAPTETAAAAVPDGAGVVASERDGKPMVTTYFDIGKNEVSTDFAAAAAPVLAYLEANPKAKVAISGFNDPSGDAAANAELSKNRAQAVQAALVALGVDEARTELVKPDDATTTDMTPEQARRVELTLVE
jgi:outer membrane protein OmpA-like peptidoglycan-associated protein